MKRDSLASYLIYLPLSIILLITRILPIPAVLALGRMAGMVVYRLNIKRRRITNANLKAAFGGRYTRKQRLNLVKDVFKHFGQSLIELFLMPRMSNEYFKSFMKVENIQRVEEAAKKNKGILYLSAHYGNWEFCASISAVYGFPMLALAREQKPYFLNKKINHYRQIKGNKLITKGAQLREIVRHLKANGIVGVIGDQGGRSGKEVDFFGRSIFLADGTFRIAAKTGSIILPAFNITLDKGHRLVIEEPIADGTELKTEEDIEKAMLAYRDLLEKYIGIDPKQWMWGNNRWKYTTSKRIMILSDEKIGHLRQAEAAADSIVRQLPKSKTETVDLKFKNIFWRGFLTFLVAIAGKYIRCPMRYLQMALTKECFTGLEKTFTDTVICTGASTRAAALLIAKENRAKIIAIMRPAPFNPKYFDLCIIPAHDQALSGSSILITKGALNLISQEYVKTKAKELKQKLNIKEGLTLGLLIGGNSKEFEITLDMIKTLISQVKAFLKESGAQLMVTTSRRTPTDVEELIRKSFENYPQCVFKVLPGDENFDGAVGGILGLCSAVIVSGESISMVSEAATSGAYTIVFRPHQRAQNKLVKHNVFLENLKSLEVIRVADVDKISDELTLFNSNKIKLKKLNDRQELDRIIKEKILG
ncbi:MAG: ELM1/GtrOC1 family putative glycosyltransferase [Candidatus Omnitrophota bacterium]